MICLHAVPVCPQVTDAQNRIESITQLATEKLKLHGLFVYLVYVCVCTGVSVCVGQIASRYQ